MGNGLDLISLNSLNKEVLIFQVNWAKSLRIIKSLNSELQRFITKFEMGKINLQNREKSRTHSPRWLSGGRCRTPVIRE